MKRSRFLFAANILGSLYLAYLIIHFGLASGSSSDIWYNLGISIAIRIVLPHIIMVAAGVAMGWIGWVQSKRFLVILSVIGYILAAFSFAYYAEFVIVPVVLNIVAFFRLKTENISSDDVEDFSSLPEIDFSKANYCTYCGRKRDFMEKFTKQAFCKECNTQVRARIKSQLKLLDGNLETCNPKLHPEKDPELALSHLDTIEKMLESIESEREVVPFFKSSTQEYRDRLQSYTDAYKAKL